jgi:hypothetical protein
LAKSSCGGGHHFWKWQNEKIELKKKHCRLGWTAPTHVVVGTVIKKSRAPFKLFLNITNNQYLDEIRVSEFKSNIFQA